MAQAVDDIDALWASFEFYEALHHHMDIMNPLSSDQLDRVLDPVLDRGVHTILDIGCGHGELALRVGRQSELAGDVIDLSPWQISRAAARLEAAGLEAVIPWLGDGAGFEPDPAPDLVSLLGVSWIWGGFPGTLAALIERVRAGGTLVFGDIQITDENRRTEAESVYGPVTTREQQRRILETSGVDVIAEVVTGPEDWIRYDEDTADGARRWEAVHGDDAGHAARHREWSEVHRTDHTFMGWTVWVGRVG